VLDYARTLQDCLRGVIIDAEHSQKKVFRTNRRTAARPSLLERQTEYTHRRFRIPLEHAESRRFYLIERRMDTGHVRVFPTLRASPYVSQGSLQHCRTELCCCEHSRFHRRDTIGSKWKCSVLHEFIAFNRDEIIRR